MPDVSTITEEIIFENDNYFIINEIKNIIIDTIKEKENVINLKRHYIRELLDNIDNNLVMQYNLIENNKNKFLISINIIFYMYILVTILLSIKVL
jgi:hypothetical protein